MLDNLKALIWHYKKTSKNTIFLDVFLLIFASVVFLQGLSLIYLFIIYLMVYSLNNTLLDLSNSVLAGTPIKIKSVINFNSLIIWAKATILILLSLVVSLFIKNRSIFIFASVFEYVGFSYAFFVLAFALKYFISRPYRNLVFFILVGASILILFFSNVLNSWLRLALFVTLIISILIVSKILIKKLSFEKILRNEEKQ